MNNQELEGPWHVFIQTKYHNPSTLILKHAKTCDVVNKSQKYIYSKWHHILFEPRHKKWLYRKFVTCKRYQIPLMNDSSEGNNKINIIIYILTRCYRSNGNICKIFKQDVRPSKNVSRKDVSKFHRELCLIFPSQDNVNKPYKRMNLIVCNKKCDK